MLTARRIDATSGPLLRQLILYSLPLILSTMLQNLFNAMDTAVLGNMADSVAVASVGASGSVVSLVVTAFIGISNGTRIVLARMIGAKDPDRITATVDTSVLLAAGLGLIVAVLGWCISPTLLTLLQCPADCRDGAVLYLRIYFTAAPAMLLYNFCSAIITTAGNAQSPLYYMIAGGILNVILNILLCLILPNKVAAVAIATTASQVLGAVLCLRRLRRGEGSIRLQLRKMRWNNRACKNVLAMGLPIALSNALYPLGSVQIRVAVNSYGSPGIAGSHTASILANFATSFLNGASSAAGVFISQNLGAKYHDRVKRSFWHGLWLCALLGTAFGAFFVLTGRFWLNLFIADDPLAIDYGMIEIYCHLSLFGLFGVTKALDPFLQGLGYSILNPLVNIFCVLVFRILWMTFIYPLLPTFWMLMLCYSASWILLLLFNGIASMIVYARYRKGIYKKL